MYCGGFSLLPCFSIEQNFMKKYIISIKTKKLIKTCAFRDNQSRQFIKTISSLQNKFYAENKFIIVTQVYQTSYINKKIGENCKVPLFF